MPNGRIIENTSDKLEYTSIIYRNLVHSMRIMENCRRRLPLSVVENDFAEHLRRCINTSLIIDLNCYLIEHGNHKHSIGTIVNSLRNQRNEMERDMLNDVNDIVAKYEAFIEPRNELIQSIIIMRNRGYAHVDTFERLSEASEVDLVDIIDLIENSEPLLNRLREFAGHDPFRYIEDDDTIEEAFEILGKYYGNVW